MLSAAEVGMGSDRAVLLTRRGYTLEAVTLAWNVVGVAVLAYLAISTGSVALAGFGLDSLIEIGASIVVIWELSGAGEERRRRALRLIAVAFLGLAAYLVVQAVTALLQQRHPTGGPGGVVWAGVTAVVMFALAAGKSATGRELGDPVLVTEGRVTAIDGLLAVAVVLGVGLDSLAGWWWADPLAGFVIVYSAVREARQIFRG
jgi:divalent metal cation (Fe/Co/Zn/Cd) transporter